MTDAPLFIDVVGTIPYSDSGEETETEVPRKDPSKDSSDQGDHESHPKPNALVY